MNPLISIIMPNYNGYPYIKEAVRSVLKQSYKNWELIVIDDGSTDKSRRYLRLLTLLDHRIRLLTNQMNCGVAYSRNKGVESAKGEYIAFLDSDDLWEEDKLANQISFMIRKNSLFSCSPYRCINESGELLYIYRIKKNSLVLNDILKHCDVGLLTVIYRKDFFQGMKFFETERAEDYTLWIQFLKKIPAVDVYPYVTANYRIRTNSRSSNKWRVGIAIWNIYRDVADQNLFQRMYYISHFFLYFLKKTLQKKLRHLGKIPN